MRPVGLAVGHQSEFHQFFIGQVIQAEEVGARLLNGITVCLKRISIHTRQQLATAMTQTLVQIGMQIIAQVAVALYHGARLPVYHKLVQESIAVRHLVVSFCQIAYRHAFRAIHRPNPLSIGQIDANGGRRILVATQHGRTNHMGRDPLHLFFAELGRDRGMVFKPLRMATDGLGAARSLHVLVFHDSFPRGLHPQRVAVHLYKSIDEVYLSLLLLQPRDRVFVKQPQVSRAVIGDEQGDNVALTVVLGHLLGQFQPVDNLVDSSSVQSIGTIHLFHESSIALYQPRIEPERGRRIGMYSPLLFLVILLHLRLGHRFVIIAG